MVTAGPTGQAVIDADVLPAVVPNGAQDTAELHVEPTNGLARV